MTDPAHDDAGSEGFPADLLNGWKEIASFLGKGVRTVQRWEIDFGLPIYRLGSRGLIIQASKSEILAWRESVRPAEVLNEHDDAGPEMEPKVAVGPQAAERPRPQMVLGIALGVLGAGALGWQLGARATARSPARIASAEVWNAELRALDAEGRVLWTHRFEAPLVGTYLRSASSPASSSRLRLVDVDGDGSDEVAINAILDVNGPARTYVFDKSGRQLFDRNPGRPVTFGSKRFESFSALNIYSIPHPDGKSRLFVTGNHRAEFPSVLERLDARGQVLSEYWSDGFITDVRAVRLEGREFLAVGAYNNEWRGASLALLPLEDPNGRAPAVNPAYLCRDCPATDPRAFVVFPQSDVLSELTGGLGAAFVWDTHFDEPGRWRVNVRHAELTPPGQADARIGVVTYTLDGRSLAVEDVYPGPGFVAMHADLSRAHRLDHPFGPDDLQRLARVLVWRDGRYARVRVSRQRD